MDRRHRRSPHHVRQGMDRTENREIEKLNTKKQKTAALTVFFAPNLIGLD